MGIRMVIDTVVRLQPRAAFGIFELAASVGVGDKK